MEVGVIKFILLTTDDILQKWIEPCKVWPVNPELDDIIIAECGFGGLADGLRKDGYCVFGASRFSDRFSLDFKFGRDMADKFKMNPMELFQHTDFNEVLKWTEAKDNRKFLPRIDDYFRASEVADGHKMSLHVIYVNGIPRLMLSSTDGAYRFWKKNNPKVYRQTLQNAEVFIRTFKYTGFLSCDIVVGNGKIKWLSWSTDIPRDGNFFKATIDFSDFIKDVLHGEPKVSFSWHGEMKNKTLQTWKYL